MNGSSGTTTAVIFVLTLSTFVLAALVLIGNRSLQRVRATTAKTLNHAENIDHAVNGKQPGEASLSEDVATMRDKQERDNPTVSTEAPGVLPVLSEIRSEIAGLRDDVAALRAARDQ